MNRKTERLLLHICCGPCAAYPLSALKQEPLETFGFFYNPNIHPYREYALRKETAVAYAASQEARLIVRDEYDVVQFARDVVYRENDRCRVCYHKRLEATARTAKKGGFDWYSSTLLYSKMQNHEMIREIGESLGRRHGVGFLYRDFREGWKEGIRLSKEAGLYRQQYCGCIYSEAERFYRPARASRTASPENRKDRES